MREVELQATPVQLHGVESNGFQLERALLGSERELLAWRRKRPSWVRERERCGRKKRKRKRERRRRGRRESMVVLVCSSAAVWCVLFGVMGC